MESGEQGKGYLSLIQVGCSLLSLPLGPGLVSADDLGPHASPVCIFISPSVKDGSATPEHSVKVNLMLSGNDVMMNLLFCSFGHPPLWCLQPQAQLSGLSDTAYLPSSHHLELLFPGALSNDPLPG